MGSNYGDANPLSFFLQELLRESESAPSEVDIVHDDFRGLSEDDAESFLPRQAHSGMSDGSMPALHRWESHASSPASAQDDIIVEASLTKSPSLPRRRLSIEDESDSDWSDEESESGVPAPRKTRFEAMHHSLTSCKLQQCSPPRAPTRQSSLRLLDLSLDCDLDGDSTPTNLSLPEIELGRHGDIMLPKIAQRRNGLKLPAENGSLSSIQAQQSESSLDRYIHILCGIREESSLQLEETGKHDGEEGVFLHPARLLGEQSKSKDSVPSCARRRLSPQLEKYHSIADFSPACAAQRRPSPQLLERTLSSLASLPSSATTTTTQNLCTQTSQGGGTRTSNPAAQ